MGQVIDRRGKSRDMTKQYLTRTDLSKIYGGLKKWIVSTRKPES
jgi:hypothetical protein